MNWTVNITFEQEGSDTCKSVCETHELKNKSFLDVLEWIREGTDVGNRVESVSIWLDDTTEMP